MLPAKMYRLCNSQYIHKALKLRCMCTISIESNVIPIPENITYIAKQLNINNIMLANIVSKHQDKLKLHSVSRWMEIFDYMSQYDFKKSELLEMIDSNPDLLSISRNDLHECMFAWTNCHFDDKKLRQLLVAQPSCLLLNQKQILSRIPKLLPFIGNKHNRLLELISYSPNVMFDNWKEIEKKLNYLLFKMELGPNQFVTTSVMSETLFDLQCRHTFLCKLGLWKNRDPKDSVNQLSGNPSLKRMIETSEKEFAVKVAAVTVEEFIVYKQLYSKENEQNNSDSDIEEDND